MYVVPGSQRTGPDGRRDGVPRLRVKAPPEDGRANVEAEQLLSKLLGARVRLRRGARARQKTFEADVSAAELASGLAAAFGG